MKKEKFKEALTGLMGVLRTAMVEDANETIKNEPLKNNITKLNDLLNEATEIIKNEETFDKADFHKFIATCGILGIEIQEVYNNVISKDLENKMKESEGEE